ncbi:Uu.00g073560.m01.CDS01 [Anthostomella pinea]|uniref:Uu.00g073560.m01.CDS01 n=1 Tax=Anthostomella pinea TaxID=933095 RepID=A0AAI8VVB7_9PEZI|nr:Uu.00g073560.m01.CDS01 [Anthostomella pinea]
MDDSTVEFDFKGDNKPLLIELPDDTERWNKKKRHRFKKLLKGYHLPGNVGALGKVFNVIDKSDNIDYFIAKRHKQPPPKRHVKSTRQTQDMSDPYWPDEAALPFGMKGEEFLDYLKSALGEKNQGRISMLSHSGPSPISDAHVIRMELSEGSTIDTEVFKSVLSNQRSIIDAKTVLESFSFIVKTEDGIQLYPVQTEQRDAQLL